MPVIKEFQCSDCTKAFERIRPECPQCGSLNVRRVFLTPFGIAKGVAKRTDAILGAQFKKLGIANFSNAHGPGGPNKVTWSPKKFGSRASTAHGIPQPEIVPGTGVNSLIGTGFFNPASLTRDGSPYQVPADIGAGIPLGVPIGGRPQQLFDRTTIVGALDSDGRSVYRTA